MPFYVQEPTNGNWAPVWEIDDRVATRLDIHQPRGVNRFEAQEGETPWDVMRRETPWFDIAGHCPFHRLPIGPGQYYPRIARLTQGVTAITPGFLSGDDYIQYYPGHDTDAHTIALSRGRMNALTHRLERICQTVHPAADRIDKIYGNDIADLLTSACMEFESQCRGVLAANDYAPPDKGGDTNKRRKSTKGWNTNDYVQLLAPLKLAEYAIGFIAFPWLDPEKPFGAWKPDRATKTLTWYEAYHDVKHDRDKNFSKGTLAHAFRAVSACAVMMLAQYGERSVGSELRRFFLLSAPLEWSWTERYFQPLIGQHADGSTRPADWTRVSYSF